MRYINSHFTYLLTYLRSSERCVCQSEVIKELEARTERLTLEVEKVSCVKQQLQHSNTQLQTDSARLRAQLCDAQTRFGYTA